jgi:hypothetical protein
MRIEVIRKGLKSRLRGRHVEIEQAVLARVSAVSDPRDVSDPEYLEGLKGAVLAAIAYGIDALERGEERPAPIPSALLSQARLAARHRVKLEVVLRRYLAGYTLLGDFVIEAAISDGDVDAAGLKRLMGWHSLALDRLLAAVGNEYEKEIESLSRSTRDRRQQKVERLLAGEPLETSDLGYDLAGHHLAMIASGSGAQESVTELIEPLDCRRLIVAPDEETVWAWVGSRRAIGSEEVERHLRGDWTGRVALAFGEPGRSFAGWRLTHQQARAALPIARANSSGPIRYADVALLASIRQDDVLMPSLEDLYLTPLSEAHSGGAVLRKTLRAYFETGQNVTSAAAALGVNRRTVTNRLRAVEDCVGRPFAACAVDLQLALQIAELT